ncbi:hypothetical protein ACT691_00630 [Vibrio metschnikovii]
MSKLLKSTVQDQKLLINIWKDIRNDSSIEMDERKVVFAERTGLTFSKLPKNASKAVEKDQTKIKSKNNSVEGRRKT